MTAEAFRAPLATPVTAVDSRSDAVVAWQSGVDSHTLHVRHIEVRATHLGLGLSPEVHRILAGKLAHRKEASC